MQAGLRILEKPTPEIRTLAYVEQEKERHGCDGGQDGGPVAVLAFDAHVPDVLHWESCDTRRWLAQCGGHVHDCTGAPSAKRTARRVCSPKARECVLGEIGRECSNIRTCRSEKRSAGVALSGKVGAHGQECCPGVNTDLKRRADV
eukprot:scaffold172_cov254-Pinguiococcus_pyrenoidosus.AAC.36